MVLKHIVTPEESGMTLHQLLRDVLCLSARETREAKAQSRVTVDDRPFFANQPLRAGMVVRVELAEFERRHPLAQGDASVRVLWEDDALLAVYKEALLQCHPSPSAPAGSDTLEARVQRYLGAPAHPVHRLDAETTGIVLFAKLPFVQARLQQQMQTGAFKKTYQAWVYGVPDPPQGVVDAPIAPLTPDSFTRVVREDGQRAVSRYRTLQTVPIPAALVELSPITGRTHQLRVHMAHIGHPLLGDTRYASPASAACSKLLSLHYHQLCAVSLRFTHPLSGEAVCVSCEPQFSLGFTPSSICLSLDLSR